MATLMHANKASEVVFRVTEEGVSGMHSYSWPFLVLWLVTEHDYTDLLEQRWCLDICVALSVD